MRLLYVVTEDWYFLSHRLPMARAARTAGFEVHIATRLVDGAARIAAEGFTPHHIPFSRGNLSPQAVARTVSELRKLHREINPAIVHHVSLECSALGSFAAIGRSVATINAVTGFGYIFTSPGLRSKLLRLVIPLLLRTLFNRQNTTTLVQNPDDRHELLSIGVAADRLTLIPGSGVDTVKLHPAPEPDQPVVFAFVGRLLEDKGIRTLIAAYRILREQESDVRLLIAGAPDPANPTSVSKNEAENWRNEPGIEWLGHVTDISELWARAHVAVLPSRREGLPMSLLEAAACGRAMIATDVPGCREVVIPNETGILVPVDDAVALAAAMRDMAASSDLRRQYGAAARKLAVSKFSSQVIGQQIVELYRGLAGTIGHQ